MTDDLIDVASGGHVTVGAPARFQVGVYKDDAPMNLSGKELLATVRLAYKNQTPIATMLESFDAVTVLTDAEYLATDPDTEATFPWQVEVLLNDEQTALLSAPRDARKSTSHFLTLYVPEDDYPVNPVQFEVRRSAATI